MNRLLAIVLLSIPFSLFAARVDTLWTYSDAMQKEIGTTIMLPDSYDEHPNSGVLYPTVYILHGLGGSYKNWGKRMPQIAALADKYNLVLIFPDGGEYSWYLDHPINPHSKYETYISKELIASIEDSYRVSKSGAKRAITGLSMGGHGALFLALRHPGKYAAAGSMSGVLDFSLFPSRQGISDLSNISQYGVASIAKGFDTKNHTPPAIIFDCGTEDIFISSNRSLKSALDEKGINHIYEERKGTHNWNYWRASILDHLEYFDSLLN